MYDNKLIIICVENFKNNLILSLQQTGYSYQLQLFLVKLLLTTI